MQRTISATRGLAAGVRNFLLPNEAEALQKFVTFCQLQGHRMAEERDSRNKRDYMLAQQIKAGKCPFGNLKEGQSIAHCPSGFPGCACADEFECNKYLKEEDVICDS